MQITNRTALTTPSNTLATNVKADEAPYQTQGDASLNVKSHQFSDQATLLQAIDTTSDTLDDLLIKNMPAQQHKALEQNYQELDALFDKGELNAEDEKKANSLMDKIDKSFNTAFDKLSDNEKNIIDKLAQKIDKLESQLPPNESPDTYSKNEMILNAQPNLENTKGSNVEIIEASGNGDNEKNKKKSLTTAQLNALSAAELRKLSTSQLKKLNAAQLNKLSAAQLNTLELPQLKRLSGGALSQLNDAQTAKLA